MSVLGEEPGEFRSQASYLDQEVGDAGRRLLAEIFDRFSCGSVGEENSSRVWAWRLVAQTRELYLADLVGVLRRLGIGLRLFFDLVLADEPGAVGSAPPASLNEEDCDNLARDQRPPGFHLAEEDLAFADASRELLARHVAELGAREVERRLGIGRMKLWRVFYQRKRMSLELVTGILRGIGQSPRVFFDQLLAAEPESSPAQALYIFGTPRKAPECSFLDFLDACLPALRRRAGEVGQLTPAARLPKLLELEEQRYSDRGKAQRRAEALVHKICGLPVLDGADLAELALALGIWGTIERTYNRLESCGEALWRGLSLLEGSRGAYAKGDLCQRAVFLLLDLKRPSVARLFVQRAALHLEETADLAKQAGLWLAWTAVHYHSGNFEEALDCCRQGFLRASKSNWRLRVACLQNSALVLEQQGNLQEARAQLLRACDLCQIKDLSVTFMNWRLGTIALALENLAEAETFLNEAHSLSLRYAEPIDTGLITVDLATCLHRAKKPSRLRQLAADSLIVLERFRRYPQADAAMEELVALLTRQVPTELGLEKIRQSFRAARKADARQRPRGKKTAAGKATSAAVGK